MKPILEWLETKFSRHSAAVEADELDNPAESYEPGGNVLVQNKDASQETVTESDHGAQDDAEPGDSREKGFDPYNTGPLDISKSQKSRSDK